MAINANVEDLLEELYDVLDKGWTLPMSGGKIFIDGEEARTILEEIRDAIPSEIERAKKIVDERDKLISDAQKECEKILKMTEEKVRKRITQENIVKEATLKANEIQIQGQEKYNAMKRAASEYIDDVMRKADETIANSLSEIRKTRQSIKTKK